MHCNYYNILNIKNIFQHVHASHQGGFEIGCGLKVITSTECLAYINSDTVLKTLKCAIISGTNNLRPYR